MRSLLAIAILFAFAGCEVQPILGRCENDSDCDRNTTMRTARCLQTVAPHAQCSGADCRCCPYDLSNATAEVVMACTQAPVGDAMVIADATPDVRTDVVDVTDSGIVSCVPACQDGVTFCATMMTADGGTSRSCLPLRQLGVRCATAGECGTGHCAQGVCCNSACVTAGFSCNSTPDQAGLCLATMSIDSGVTPDTGIVDTGAPDAGTPDAGTPDAGAMDTGSVE